MVRQNLRGVKIGRRSPRHRGQFCTPKHTSICWARCGPYGQIRSGAVTSPTFRCAKASCIWSLSWTGLPARCWRGASPTSSHGPPPVRGPWRGEADFCVEALNEAIHKFGPPEILNADQGSQFTSFDWTDRLKRAKTEISLSAIACNRLPAMDGWQSPIPRQPSGNHSDQWRSCPRHVTPLAVPEV